MTSPRDPQAVAPAEEVPSRPADLPTGAPGPGRRVVLEPTPPGLWQVLLGVAVAALAPLFGFLIGASIGMGGATAALDPIVLSLFLGVVVGGIGVVVAILGGVRLWKHSHPLEVPAEEAGPPPQV